MQRGTEESQRYPQMFLSFIQRLHPESCWLPCGKMYEVKVRKSFFVLQGMGRKLDLYSLSNYKIFKVWYSLCFFFFFSPGGMKLHRPVYIAMKIICLKLTWPSSYLMGESPHQSMDSFGFPGKMGSPCEGCWQHCSVL